MDDNKTLNRAEIIAALRCKPQDGSECDGCPYAGTVDGCDTGAIMSDAAALLEQDAEPSNDPLTLEELREMAGDPVWWSNTTDCFASIVIPAYHNEPIWVLAFDTQTDESWRRKAKRLLQCGYKPYRRKPDGGGE